MGGITVNIVSFNAATCDPTGEGDALAEAITDSVHENDASAIEVLLQAAECLGAEFVRLDDDLLVDRLYENDAWREQLKTAIAEAEALLAADADYDVATRAIEKHASRDANIKAAIVTGSKEND